MRGLGRRRWSAAAGRLTPWRCIGERVHKVVLLTFRVLRGSALRYLGLLVAVADLPGPGGRALLSASITSQLVVSPIKLRVQQLKKNF